MSFRLAEAGRFAFRYRGSLLPMGVALLLVPSPDLMRDPAVAGLIGLAIALAGQLIRSATVGLEYIIRGGKDRQVYAERLVTGGMYSHVRNPMYLGNFLLVLGVSMASDSWVFLLVGVPLVVFMHKAIVAAEEELLRTMFGAEFDAFCARSPRWVPKLAGLGTTFHSMTFNWRRMLVEEYQKPFDWLAALALVVIVNIARAGLVDRHSLVVGLMVAVIVVRFALYVAARMAGRKDQLASADRDPAGAPRSPREAA